MARPSPPVYPDCPDTAVAAWRLGLPLRYTTWSAWDALWAVLISVVLGNGIAVVILLAGGDLSSPWILLALVGPWIGLVGWPILSTARRGNGAVIDLGWRFRGFDWLAGLGGGIAAFVVGVVVGAVTIAIFGDFSSAAGDQAQELAQDNGFWVLAIFAILVVVGAPIAEELTFRGLLWSGLAKRGVPVWATVLISSVAFSLLHFEPARLPLLFSIGVVLGIVRWKTRSLGACVVAHAVNNFPGALGILALAGGGVPS